MVNPIVESLKEKKKNLNWLLPHIVTGDVSWCGNDEDMQEQVDSLYEQYVDLAQGDDSLKYNQIEGPAFGNRANDFFTLLDSKIDQEKELEDKPHKSFAIALDEFAKIPLVQEKILSDGEPTEIIRPAEEVQRAQDALNNDMANERKKDVASMQTAQQPKITIDQAIALYQQNYGDLPGKVTKTKHDKYRDKETAELVRLRTRRWKRLRGKSNEFSQSLYEGLVTFKTDSGLTCKMTFDAKKGTATLKPWSPEGFETMVLIAMEQYGTTDFTLTGFDDPPEGEKKLKEFNERKKECEKILKAAKAKFLLKNPGIHEELAPGQPQPNASEERPDQDDELFYFEEELKNLQELKKAVEELANDPLNELYGGQDFDLLKDQFEQQYNKFESKLNEVNDEQFKARYQSDFKDLNKEEVLASKQENAPVQRI